jgi:acetylornithine deacetylase
MSHTEPENVVELLASMVSIESVNPTFSGDGGGESKVMEYLTFVAAVFGFSVRRLPVANRGENLLVICERDPNRPWVLFDSHIDTVSADNMVIDPFGAVIHDGKLWGRGSCDTKGSGAAMLWALHEHARAGEYLSNVAVLFSVDEEVAMRGIRSFIDNDYSTLGFGRPGVVIGEPTRLRLVVAHNGMCRMRVRTRGVAAHASCPAAGKSAISSMARIITGLEQGYIAELDRSDELTGRAQCSINTIRGGSAANVIPDLCEVEIDRRMVPGEDPDEVVAGLRSALSSIRQTFPEIDYEMDVFALSPPLTRNPTSPLADAVRRALSRESLPADEIGVPYSTNAGDLGRKGIDTVVFGPGDVAQAHTRDEWIDMEELRQSVRVYRAIMAGR